MRSLMALLMALALVPCSGYSQTALLDSVLAAHGVTAVTPPAKLKFEGRYERAGTSPVSFVLKTRGYGEARLEILTPGRTNLIVQSQGFRWTRDGQDPVRDYDGRVSFNLPVMDSPSTGLLPFLLARRSELETSQEDGILDGRLVTLLRVRIPDNDRNHLRIGVTFHRVLDLLIDRVTYRVTAAAIRIRATAITPNPGDDDESESYSYTDYFTANGLLFPATVTRSSKLHSSSLTLRPVSVLRIDRVSVDLTISDDDFRRP